MVPDGRGHPCTRSVGVLSIIITANSSFRQPLFKHVHQLLTGIRRVKEATRWSRQGNRRISRRKVPITARYREETKHFLQHINLCTPQWDGTKRKRVEMSSSGKTRKARNTISCSSKHYFFFNAAPHRSRCTGASTMQHHTTLLSAPSSSSSSSSHSHCDFTRCRRRHRSQRGRQLRALVTLSLYRRTRNS